MARRGLRADCKTRPLTRSKEWRAENEIVRAVKRNAAADERNGGTAGCHIDNLIRNAVGISYRSAGAKRPKASQTNIT